jgi:hypothetical protein
VTDAEYERAPSGAAAAVAGTKDPSSIGSFLRLSEMLTGFDRIELLATGMVEPYYDELNGVIGAREVGALLAAAEAVDDAAASEDEIEAGVRSRILDDDRFGPVARNIITMWYLGNWSQLPREWRNSYGAMSLDYDRVISAKAYREGLVWPAAGTHPMGAKQPGFGSWSAPPPGATE